MNKYLISGCILLFFLLCMSMCALDNVIQENYRLSDNYDAATDSITSFKTKSGKNGVENSVLTLSISEIKKSQADIVSEVKDLKIKLRNVNTVSHEVFNTQTNISTKIKDSVIIDSVKYAHFSYSDTYNKIDGYLKGDSVILNNSYNDSLIVVSHFIRKKILFLRIGRKQLFVSAKLANPNSKITYNKFIENKKMKR